MQYEVDEYVLEYIENENKYYISFKDSTKRDCKIEIDKEIFDTYMKSKKAYIKIKNEKSRHLEHRNLTEIELYKRSFKSKETVEEIVLKNIENERIGKALKSLTKTQSKRIELHIINNITIGDIAKLEGVRKGQIQKSLKLGIKKLKKILK